MDEALKNAILKNKVMATELKHVLDDLIPQLVRYNSVMFTGATDPVIAQEMNAGVIVTADLYQLSEALNAAAVDKPVQKSRNKKAKEAPAIDPVPASDPTEITPQPLEELPEHAASTVGEKNDSNKSDAQ